MVKESKLEFAAVPEYLKLESIKVVSLDERPMHVNDLVGGAPVE